MLDRIRIDVKVYVIAGLSAIGLAVLGSIAVLQGRDAEATLVRMTRTDLELLIDLDTLYAMGLQSGQATRNVMLNPADQTGKDNYHAADRAFVEALESARKLAPPGMADRLQRVAGLWAEDDRLKTRVQELAQSGKRDEAVELLVKQETPKWRAERSLLLELLEDQKQLFHAGSDSATSRIHRGRWLVLSTLSSVLAASVLLSLLIARSVARSIRTVVSQSHELSSAVERGVLSKRGDVSAAGVEFRPIIEGMNASMEAFSKPMEVTVEYVQRIARGDLPPRITETYAGDFDTIKQSLNTCIDTLSRLIGELNRMSAEHDRGDVDATIEASRFQGAYATVAAGVNGMVAGHIALTRKAMACVAEFGKGNFDAPLERFPGKKASINETVEKVRSSVKGFIAGMDRMSAAHGRGDIDETLDAQRFEGDFRRMAEGVNAAVGLHVRNILEILQIVGAYAEGDFRPVLRALPGKQVIANQKLDLLRSNLTSFTRDVQAMVTAAAQGQLARRADASAYHGDWAELVKSLNAALDAVVGPVNEAAQVLDQLARRDLRARVKGSYQGDHARMKDALNATAEALQEAMGQVAEAVSQVSSAAGQIAASSQAVADGASQQAASLQETSSSLESMAAMTRRSADNAQQANGLAQSARSAAAQGGTAMQQMTSAMGKIKVAAEGTSEIIKDINEIAFQTNLLALNAAVEAARAGDAGRGFAVVAEEVRSLALRSKEAATKTEQLIRESVNQAGQGEATALQVGGKLGEIAASVSKVTDIVAEIAASAVEQAAGIDQVNRAVAQMERVTQQNASSSEESSSAAAELSGQSEELAAMVGTFQLERPATVPGPTRSTLEGATLDAHALERSTAGRRRAALRA